MTLLEFIARSEFAVRHLTRFVPPALTVRAFTGGRNMFLSRLASARPTHVYNPHPQLGVDAWGLHFRMPIWNAAGMFKKGLGYESVARQGAGGFVAGTTTSRARRGNIAKGIAWPSTQYPYSHSASNWMGLPNEGHAEVAQRLLRIQRTPGCPLGASVSSEPGLDAAQALPELIDGMHRYEGAGVDYLELNESCPNVPGHAAASQLDDALLRRLDAVANGYLVKRSRRLPVVVKLSTDTDLDQIPQLVRELVDRGFDGIILGNTSTKYAVHRENIDERDRLLFDYFTTTYGGGLSGAVLRASSLETCKRAMEAVRRITPKHEFHVIRCGGVMSASDILESQSLGIHLHQWYVGYFEGFAEHGYGVYRALAESILETRTLTES